MKQLNNDLFNYFFEKGGLKPKNKNRLNKSNTRSVEESTFTKGMTAKGGQYEKLNLVAWIPLWPKYQQPHYTPREHD